MAGITLEKINRLTFKVTHDGWPFEFAMFSTYTGKRAQSNYPNLIQEMADFVDGITGSNTGNIIDGGAKSWELSVDEWNNPIFGTDSWSSVYKENHSVATSTSSLLPPRVSLVVTQRSYDSLLPEKRSYNRFYLPYISQTRVTSNGLVDASAASQVQLKVQTFHNSLQGISPEAGVGSEFSGLCNATYKGAVGFLFPSGFRTDECWVGDMFDTQRRRSNAYRENYTRIPLTGGVVPSSRTVDRRERRDN